MQNKLSIYLLILLAMASFVDKTYSQVTIQLDEIPNNTPSSSDIYISGDFEGWTGGQSDYRLSLNEDGHYGITLPERNGSIQFKFTLGSWDTVEKGAQGQEIPNRSYTFTGQSDSLFLQVLNWAGVPGGQSTAADNVYVVNDWHPSIDRTLRIYLPPDYHNTDRHYPVIYMHDGQNLFDQETAFAGEWMVDETLNDMHAEDGLGIVVVGIDNAGADRIDEYTYFTHPQYGGGEGATYLNWIINEVKPFIDTTYRVHTQPENTAVIGSSLGGLISHDAVLRHADVFSKGGIFSPSYWFSDRYLLELEDYILSSNVKLYFMAGDREGASVVPNIDEMIHGLIQYGFSSDSINRKVVPGGQHNEALWAQELREAVEWLFQSESTGNGQIEQDYPIQLYPNPFDNTLYIKDGPGRIAQFFITSIAGIPVSNGYVDSLSIVDLSGLMPGNYLISFTDQAGQSLTTSLISKR